jgi:hypothetical protein
VPVGTVGQAGINAVIGGTQTALEGRSAKDIGVGSIECGIAGRIGGPGYVRGNGPFYLDSAKVVERLCAKDAIIGARRGMIAGGAASYVGSVIQDACGKAKDMFFSNKRKEENGLHPAR